MSAPLPTIPGTTLDEMSKGKAPASVRTVFEPRFKAESAPFVPGQSGKSRRRKSKKATRKARKTRRR